MFGEVREKSQWKVIETDLFSLFYTQDHLSFLLMLTVLLFCRISSSNMLYPGLQHDIKFYRKLQGFFLILASFAPSPIPPPLLWLLTGPSLLSSSGVVPEPQS